MKSLQSFDLLTMLNIFYTRTEITHNNWCHHIHHLAVWHRFIYKKTIAQLAQWGLIIMCCQPKLLSHSFL